MGQREGGLTFEEAVLVHSYESSSSITTSISSVVVLTGSGRVRRGESGKPTWKLGVVRDCTNLAVMS